MVSFISYKFFNRREKTYPGLSIKHNAFLV